MRLPSPPTGFGSNIQSTRQSTKPSQNKTSTLQPFKETGESLNIWSSRISKESKKSRESSTENNVIQPVRRQLHPSSHRSRISANRFNTIMKETLEIQSIPAQISHMQKEIMKKKQLLRTSQSASDKDTSEQKKGLKTKLEGEIRKLEQMVAELRDEQARLSASLHSHSQSQSRK
jgi:hypothetical protein